MSAMKYIESSLVSVIIPVYNGAGFIVDALESVRHQVYSAWECIVIDDGSTDGTADIVADWVAATREVRVTCYSQVNKGLSAARNAGLSYAQGDYIQFLDADDVLLPEKIAKQMMVLNDAGRDELIVCYTDYAAGVADNVYERAPYYMSARFDSMDHVGELITRWESDLSIPPHCFLFSAGFFRERGIRFNEALPNHEDFECWLRIFLLDPPVFFIDDKLCIYRISDGSMSKKMRLMGEGFLQVLDHHIAASNQRPDLKRLLLKKRLAVLRSYNRFDRMTWRDRLFSFKHLWSYYCKQIKHKTGLLSS